MATPAPIRVDIIDASRRLPGASVEWLRAHVEKAMTHLGCAGEVRARIVEDAEMARSHEEFAGVPGTTDVLTFDLNDPEEAGQPPRMDLEHARLVSDDGLYGIDTDILACIDEAERHAGGGGGGPGLEKELLLYILHGILHCLGMDDHDEVSFEAMHRVEDGVLRGIGVGAVFLTRPPPEPGSGA